VQVTARTAAVFGSFGWSGEARRMIVQRLESMRLKVVDEGPPVKFTPADEDLAGYRQFGRDFVTRMCGCR
jgi:flavorubredoxin